MFAAITVVIVTVVVWITLKGAGIRAGDTQPRAPSEDAPIPLSSVLQVRMPQP